jgi:hypothetical protein
MGTRSARRSRPDKADYATRTSRRSSHFSPEMADSANLCASGKPENPRSALQTAGDRLALPRRWRDQRSRLRGRRRWWRAACKARRRGRFCPRQPRRSASPGRRASSSRARRHNFGRSAAQFARARRPWYPGADRLPPSFNTTATGGDMAAKPDNHNFIAALALAGCGVPAPQHL